MTPIGSALDLRSIWVDGQASHDPVGGAWENVAGEEGREVLKEIDFSKIDLLHKNAVHWSMYTHVDNSKVDFTIV